MGDPIWQRSSDEIWGWIGTAIVIVVGLFIISVLVDASGLWSHENDPPQEPCPVDIPDCGPSDYPLPGD